MSETENLATIRQTWAAWNAHDADAWVKLLDEKHVTESDTIPQPIGGHEGARAFMQMYEKAFPDLHFAIDQMIASGDYVVTRYTAPALTRVTLVVFQPRGDTPRRMAAPSVR